jgi:hypothetical protein
VFLMFVTGGSPVRGGGGIPQRIKSTSLEHQILNASGRFYFGAAEAQLETEQLKAQFARRLLPLFFLGLEKIKQPGECNNMFCRQNRANQIRLRSGVDLIQMMLRCGLRHEPLNAFVESAVNYHIGTCAEGGAYAFSVD